MKLTLRIIAILCFIFSFIWFLVQPSFEPLLAFLTGLATLIVSFKTEKEELYSSKETIEPNTYQILLDHVENFWVKGILEKSLHGAALLELGIREDHQAVNYPWMVHREVNNEPISPNKDMLDIFHDIGMGRSLLILGEPGSGKTTMLLELCRQLVILARQNDDKPIPIVLNLSSWSEKESITEWLTEQLNSFYKVDKKIAQALLNTNNYILLLDGLDEVKKEYRNACIKAINDFRNERGLIQVALCCRSEEYSELDSKLDFEGAITIQPLTSEKVDEYLDRFGNRLADIRNLLNKYTTLHELTKTPLMLSIMTLTYLDMPKEDIQINGDIETQRKLIFVAYINRMFQRPGRAQTNQFSKERTLHFLSYLARKMIQHNEVPFLVERLQPSWLDKKNQQRVFFALARVIIGLLIGLLIGLVSWLFGNLEGLFLMIFFGLLSGLIFGLFFEKRFDKTIKPVGFLEWSWKGFYKGFRNQRGFALLSMLYTSMFFGLLIGLLIGLIGGLFFGLLIGLVVWLIFGLVGGLSVGLKVRQVEKTTYPNQNIVLSIKNSLRSLIIFVILIGPFFGLVFELVFGPFFGQGVGLVIGLVYGLFLGLFYALIFGGGGSFIQHFILRYIIFKNKDLPLQLIPFLKYASDLILLRKVGGGYIFMHRLLMEHFSEMDVLVISK